MHANTQKMVNTEVSQAMRRRDILLRKLRECRASRRATQEYLWKLRDDIFELEACVASWATYLIRCNEKDARQ